MSRSDRRRRGKQGQLRSGNEGPNVQPVVKMTADECVHAPCENDWQGHRSHNSQQRFFQAGQEEELITPVFQLLGGRTDRTYYEPYPRSFKA
jgi:hypothetical protein